MTLISLPEPLQCPDSWKYPEEWKDRYEKKHGLGYLSGVCGHSEAGFNILYYIYYYGEVALTKIKTQNLYIKRLAEGRVDPTEIGDYDIDWQSGATWVRINEHWEELFEIYNAKLAPADILSVIDEVKEFMDAGQRHCQSLLLYLNNAREVLENQRAAEREQEDIRQILEARSSKWDLIDVTHSKLIEGFIYLLSNDLMPGVYKIGFTAGNPDKRAREISIQYGLPMPFEVVEYWRTHDPYIVEQRIHQALAVYGKAGEFFELDIAEAIEIIEANLQNH